MTPATGVAFAPDGATIAASGGFGAGIWDVASGQAAHAVRGSRRMGDRIHFSSDGAQVVTASDDGTARVWDASTGAQQALIRERHSDPRCRAQPRWAPGRDDRGRSGDPPALERVDGEARPDALASGRLRRIGRLQQRRADDRGRARRRNGPPVEPSKERAAHDPRPRRAWSRRSTSIGTTNAS